MGTTGMWRPHGDNVDKMSGQHGDHKDVETMWEQMETTWGQHEDNVETPWGPLGLLRPHGDIMETTWGQHEDNVR